MNELTTTQQQQQDTFERVLSIIDMTPTSKLSDASKAQYKRSLLLARDAGVNLLNPDSVREHMAAYPSDAAFFSPAVQRYYGQVASDIRRTPSHSLEDRARKTDMLEMLDELRETVKGMLPERGKGAPKRNWLTLREVARLRQTINGRTGRRDAVAIGLLVSAGLRRDEAVNLRWQDVTRQGERTVLHIVGKGSKARNVPVSESFGNLLQDWRAFCQADDSERVLRGLAAGGTLTDSLTAQQLFNIVRKWCSRIGRPELSPHDLRRTYARLAYEAGVPLLQIQLLLGHADSKTTADYIGVELDMDATASDVIPW